MNICSTLCIPQSLKEKNKLHKSKIMHFFLRNFTEIFEMSSKSCQNCGGTDIDRDSARGDAVCTSCGTVLEDNIIVAEIQFEENAYGGIAAIGQFVGNDAQGGTGFINAYRGGGGKESREITMKKARDRISTLAHQLK